MASIVRTVLPEKLGQWKLCLAGSFGAEINKKEPPGKQEGDVSKMSSDSSTSPDKAVEHWQRTKSLMWITLAIWFVFGFVVHFFVSALNEINFIGFPLGFYMAAQGSLIVFVVLIFWYASKQNQIDEDCGMAED